MMHKRLDELSRGSSQERVSEVYQTLPDRPADLPGSDQRSRHDSDGRSFRQESREGSSHAHNHKARVLKSR